MTQTDRLVSCANCGRPARETEAAGLGWVRYLDDDGTLSRACPLCARFCSAVVSRIRD